MGGDGATMLMEVEGTVLVPSHDAAAPSPAGLARGRQRSPAAPREDAATGRPAHIREPEQHRFSGTVAVNVGPFEELDSIGRFAASLSSVPGVGGVRIRTFDGRS